MQRQLRYGATLSALALATAACGGPSITRDRDPNVPIPVGATWAWGARDTVSRYEMDPAAQNPILHQRVQAAVETEMQARGFTKVDLPSQANLVVTYHIGIKRESELQTTTSGMSAGWYGGYGWGMYGAPTFATSTTREVQYQTGGLLIYIRNRADSRVAWRGLFTTDIHDPDRVPAEAVTRAVNTTFGDLRAGS